MRVRFQGLGRVRAREWGPVKDLEGVKDQAELKVREVAG